jgi:hypothetical protein
MDAVSFVGEYSGDDRQVRFAWNGKHTDGFVDENEEFRREVIDEVLRNPDAAPVPLVRDLFRAETQWAVQAWCVDRRVRELASLMLTKGGAAVLDEFVEGRARSMDTWFECDMLEIAPATARSLQAEVERRLEESAHDPADRELLSDALEFFRRRA